MQCEICFHTGSARSKITLKAGRIICRKQSACEDRARGIKRMVKGMMVDTSLESLVKRIEAGEFKK